MPMNAPTLIVGLGGKGSDVVLRVSKMVTEEQKKQIGFAVFDTDINELREIEKKNPFVKTIQTSTKLSVGEYLDIDTHARDTWFPVNAILNSKTLTEGAGQVRAVSRLAFETAIRAGKMETLHKAIEDLYKLEGDEHQQALRIIIVSSLAGGTGSGLILPVALYIKHYLKTRFRQSANITRGFFLLPEVFYEVIKGQAERNNLKSNAYATLRELDAFLMKGDSTLPERYRDSVTMHFPCVGSGEFEEYDERPFDFCFLFDAQNADGKKLNSFNQYLDHAANCIYAQSIGPMNKRSNSSEDNTIRKLVQERGRNRYAGAGTSMLIYPMEDVRSYIALRWAEECVSKQWMVMDDDFKIRRQEIAKMRREGIKVQDLHPGRFYIDTIEQKAKNKDPFAMAIVNACTHYDETGFTKLSDRWDDYLFELDKKIREDNSQGAAGQVELDIQASNVQAAIGELTALDRKELKDWDKFADAYHALLTYKGMCMKHVNEAASTVAYTIFRSGDSVTTDRLPYRLETYLRDGDSFIHPCAVRYFLYKVLEAMEKSLAFIEKKCKDETDFFDSFVQNNFDDPDTDTFEDENSLASTKRVTFMDSVLGRLSADQETLISNYSEYLSNINKYRVDAVMAAVLKDGIAYVTKLTKAFENFYKSLDEKVKNVTREANDIAKKYEHLKGTAARYICASPECLDVMLEKMPYTGGFIDIDSDLAEGIYNNVRDYAMLTARSEDRDYFGEIFENGILGYFRKNLMETYASEIDLDIITAIEREAEYEGGATTSAEIMQYVREVFSEAKVLAAPFIEKPLGEEKDPINACAINDKLHPRDDSPRATLIEQELMNFGGVADSDIPKNMILFYKSFYGLRANDLSKFAPPAKAETYNRTGGEYYKAYFELVSKINPQTHKSKAITPHIDRWWHNVSMMPDLDEGNQERQENEVNAAFFWGMVNGYFDLYETGRDEATYLLQVDELGMDEDSRTLVVSNSTPCDTLYEVMDALSIYPELVARILDKVEGIVKEEQNKNVPLSEGILSERLAKFRLSEFPLEDHSDVRSIFDLPMLFKRSTTTELYYEEKVVKMLKIEIAEIEKYLLRFCTKKELPDVFGEILMNQFELFLKNMAIEQKRWKDLYKDGLFSRICNIVAATLDELGCTTDAKAVREKDEDLRK